MGYARKTRGRVLNIQRAGYKMTVIQLLINGILLGSVYALLGLGMSMIFGIVGLTNLAHGEFIIVGAYVSTLAASALGVEPVLTLLISVPLMFFIGFFLQYFLINPAMDKGQEPALLVTFGLSIILQDGMLLFLTADARHIPASYALAMFHLGGLDISVLDCVLFSISAACVVFLAFFLNRTYTGRAIRAVSDDQEAAMLSGINVKKIYAVAMGAAMATAAAAGLCVGLKWTFYPSSGGQYLLTAFIVVAIGGMGSIPGTMTAGIIFGLAQVIGGANYGLVISYVLILIAMAVRPGRRGGRL